MILTLGLVFVAMATKPVDVALELGVPEISGLPDLPAKYLPDAVAIEDVKKSPEKYPIRAVVLVAADAMRASYKLKPIDELLQTRVEIYEKKRILEFQEQLAAAILRLREAYQDLTAMAGRRNAESSARWQAHYDFLVAATKLRVGMLEELNLAYGTVHKNELPAINPPQNGWKLDAVDKMQSKRDIRAMVDDARDGFEEVIKSHPGTLWAKLAERELSAKPGLHWVTAEIKPPPPPKVDPKRRKRP